jgi:hypothetical protein
MQEIQMIQQMAVRFYLEVVDAFNGYYAYLRMEDGTQVGDAVCLGDGVDAFEDMKPGDPGFIDALEDSIDDEMIEAYWGRWLPGEYWN